MQHAFQGVQLWLSRSHQMKRSSRDSSPTALPLARTDPPYPWHVSWVQEVKALPMATQHATGMGGMHGVRQSPTLHQSLGAQQQSQSHRIIESLRLERAPRSLSPTVIPPPPCPLTHIPQCHIYPALEHLQGWWLHHLHGQPVPLPHCSFSVFPNTLPELPDVPPSAAELVPNEPPQPLPLPRASLATGHERGNRELVLLQLLFGKVQSTRWLLCNT